MDSLEFGPFRADVQARVVRRDGQAIPLPGKAFELLLALLQKPGEALSKDELMKAVWPDIFVEEGNLTQTIFVLRKALGDVGGEPLIVTVPRQGYRFAGQVRLLTEPPSENAALLAGLATPSNSPRSIPWPWVAAAVLAVAAAAGWWYAWRLARPEPSGFMSLSVDLGPDAIGSGSTVIISPDGSRIVFSIRGSDGKTMLAVRYLNQPLSRASGTPLLETVGATFPFFSADGQWLAYIAGRKLKKIPINGGAPVTICEAPEFGGGSWGEDGQIIASLGPAGGLFRISASGGKAQPIANPADHKQARWAWPQILPGGDSVLYTANDAVKNFDEANIEVLSLKTKKWKTLQRRGYYGRYLRSGHLVWVRNRTLFAAGFDPADLEIKSTPVSLIEEDLASKSDDGAGQFDSSATGTLVYFPGGLERSIGWMDAQGRTQSLITTLARYRDASLSPDGKLLAVAAGMSQSEIRIFDLERNGFPQRTFLKGCRIPAWTSDGRHLLFACTNTGDGTIWWTRADGAGEPYALYRAPGSVERFSLSPDGGTLLVVTRENDIQRVSLDMSNPDRPKAGSQERIMRMAQHGSTVAFSPDARWIAYSNHDEGESGIYVRPAGVGAQVKWQISSGPGRHPVWNRSAPQLLYQDNEGHVLVVDYAIKGEAFSPGTPRRWVDKQFALGMGGLPARVFDLAPDGKHIVAIINPVEDERTANLHVTFLVNFFDELRRRLPDSAR